MTQEQLSQLATKFHFARRIKKITQEQVALAIGVSQPYYQRFEKGNACLSIPQLYLVCRLLDVSFKECLEVCIGVDFLLYPDPSLSAEVPDCAQKVEKIRRIAEEELRKQQQMITKLKSQLQNLQKGF